MFYVKICIIVQSDTPKTNTKPIILHITRTGCGSEAILKDILKTQLYWAIWDKRNVL